MKFGDKYELLESLTIGGVETFVANDKIRGQRVLVHILECEAQKPNQPTVQWVLESFRRVAPEPAATVLETGRYSGTLYAYVVTKMPTDAALKNWLQLYVAHARDTQEISVVPPNPTAENGAPLPDMSSHAPQFSGPMSPSPRNLQPPPKPEASRNPLAPPPRPLPNVQLGGERSGLHPVVDRDGMAGLVPPVKSASEFSKNPSFSSAFAPPKFPAETSSPPVKDKPGEFTSFFQGPFRPDVPSETPSVSSQPLESPRKKVGEFTAMFNSPVREEPAAPSGGIAGNEPAGTGFTAFFNPASISSPTPGAGSLGGSTPVVKESSQPFPSAAPETSTPPAPASFAMPPMLPVAMPPIFSIPPLPDPVKDLVRPKPPTVYPSDATNAFTRPPDQADPVQPAPIVGPSAYTQIISVRSSLNAGGQERGAANSPAGGFAAAMPPLPAITPPPMPAPPPPPKMAAPKAPKAPKMDAPEPPAVSYWPLILTLTVIFFLAALLVLYFVLKH